MLRVGVFLVKGWGPKGLVCPSKPRETKLFGSISRDCYWDVLGLSRVLGRGCGEACEPFFPLQHSKTPRTPNLSKICPDDCFSGFQSGGPKFVKNLSKNWKTTISGQIFNFSTNFWQIWVPLIGTPKNNRRDKFWTNLGFGPFFECCKGKKGFARRSTFQWKKGLFSEKGGGNSGTGGLVRTSTGKATQWSGLGPSVNRRILKTAKLLSSSPSRKSALTWGARRVWTINVLNFCPVS